METGAQAPVAFNTVAPDGRKLLCGFAAPPHEADQAEAGK
ncbi:hypothetical protein AAKU55_005479 [Oxalobacteraceae bacterium GrIS 1.11]